MVLLCGVRQLFLTRPVMQQRNKEVKKPSVLQFSQWWKVTDCAKISFLNSGFSSLQYKLVEYKLVEYKSGEYK